MNKNFIRLNFKNMEEYYNSHKLIKGALVRYRFNRNIMNTYGLKEEEEKWRVGIISSINWYVIPPYSSYGIHPITTNETPMRDRVCYDLSVHNINEGNGIEIVNLESNEIYLLTD